MSAGFRTRKFVAWGSTPRPGSRAASVTLGYHHKPFGSARTARGPRALDLVGSAPRSEAGRVPRGRAPGSVDRYTTSPESVFRGAREGWNGYHDFSTAAVWPGTARAPPQAPIPAAGGAVAASETGCSRPRDIGTRRRCPTHSREGPRRHGHARLARRSTLCRVVAGYHPLTRTYVYHQLATQKPSALGESG